MVSNARLELPLPLGPVTTVSFPSGRSRSIPLRLFCRAPRISTQSFRAGAARPCFLPIFEPTGNIRCQSSGSQISANHGCLVRYVTRLVGHWVAFRRGRPRSQKYELYSLNRAARFFCCCSNSFGMTPPNESKNSLCAAISFCHSS